MKIGTSEMYGHMDQVQKGDIAESVEYGFRIVVDSISVGAGPASDDDIYAIDQVPLRVRGRLLDESGYVTKRKKVIDRFFKWRIVGKYEKPDRTSLAQRIRNMQPGQTMEIPIDEHKPTTVRNTVSRLRNEESVFATVMVSGGISKVQRTDRPLILKPGRQEGELKKSIRALAVGETLALNRDTQAVRVAASQINCEGMAFYRVRKTETGCEVVRMK